MPRTKHLIALILAPIAVVAVVASAQQPSTSAQQSSSAVAGLTSRRTTAVTYEADRETKVDLVGTPMMPRTRGEAEIKTAEKSGPATVKAKVKGGLIEPYYTPGTALPGRCLYPFLNARISFSGKAYFCPFIRIEVGDLTEQSLEEIWTGERYVALRQKLVQNGLFPVCRRCCKVELSAEPAGAPEAVPADPELAAIGAN
jgi:hypothetical protein